jgi:CRISPR system Cascade subunit CasD
VTAPTLLLRLEAPLMAFGGVAIDQHGSTRRLPGLSTIAGLLANALGYRHGEAARLDRLQARLRFAAMLLREGEALRDYQTVDLGQRHLVDTGWTTHGRREDRAGAASTARGTHIRLRDYRADALVLVALRLDPADEAPTLDDVRAAIDAPARPLFIGRKACLPAQPLCLPGGSVIEAVRLVDALRLGAARIRATAPDAGWLAEWPEEEGPVDAPAPAGSPAASLPDLDVERLFDRRDWANQIHTGERRVRAGLLRPLPAAAEAEGATR